MTTQPPHSSQAGDDFLSQVFENADPEVAQFMARHNALLERVALLERAIEGAEAMLAVIDCSPVSWTAQARRVLRHALDA